MFRCKTCDEASHNEAFKDDTCDWCAYESKLERENDSKIPEFFSYYNEVGDLIEKCRYCDMPARYCIRTDRVVLKYSANGDGGQDSDYDDILTEFFYCWRHNPDSATVENEPITIK